MRSDPYPIYCRSCHRPIDASTQVCPHCGEPQGLVAPPSQPAAPSSAPVAPAAPSARQAPEQRQAAWQPSAPNAAAPAVSLCSYCQTQVTQGDLFCRACGRPLASGLRRPSGGDDGAGKAYAISAWICAILAAGPIGVILGLIAMAKGSRGAGCGAVVFSIITTAILVIVGGIVMKQFVGQALQPNPMRGLGL